MSSLLKKVPFEYGVNIKVTLKDGTIKIGKYTGYNHADENEENIASIDLSMTNPLEYWGLFEDEIEKIELI